MSDLPTTRAEALSLGLPYYFTGQPCKHGHIAKRRVKNGDCVECAREAMRKYREAHPEKVREGDRRWRAENADKERERCRKWKAANREKAREQSRQWAEANRDKRNAVDAARNARKLNATPLWADLAAIKSIYAKCAQVNAETGIKHHVDHIVPLKGRNVCGLHVETNLQILTASENIKKGNRLPHDRRCCPA